MLTAFEAFTNADGDRPQWVFGEGEILTRNYTPGQKGAGNHWRKADQIDHTQVVKKVTVEGTFTEDTELTTEDNRRLRDKLDAAPIQQYGDLLDLLDGLVTAWEAEQVAAEAAEAAARAAQEAAQAVAVAPASVPVMVGAPTQAAPLHVAPTTTVDADRRVLMDTGQFLVTDAIYDSYEPVKLGAKSKYDFEEICKIAMANELNISLTGPTGCGKSFLPMAIAKKWGIPAYKVSANAGISPEDLQGRTEIIGGDTWFFESPVAAIVREGNAILVIDEGQFLAPDIAGFFHPLTDHSRRLELTIGGYTIPAGPNLLVVITKNPAGYNGSIDQSPAMLDRFVSFDMDYDVELEKKLVGFSRLHDFAANVRDNKDEYRTPLSTRMLVNYDKLARLFDVTFAAERLFDRFAAGSERDALVQVFELIVGDASDYPEYKAAGATAVADDVTFDDVDF